MLPRRSQLSLSLYEDSCIKTYISSENQVLQLLQRRSQVTLHASGQNVMTVSFMWWPAFAAGGEEAALSRHQKQM